MSEMLLGLLREEMQFEVKLDPAAGTISADPGQIEQVIMNLVVNARDAMPRGGKLTLQTAHVASDAPRTGSFYGVPSGDFVMLAVSDTGVGMDADTQSRIFEPFFTTKNKDKGTGLGLSVVYNIVRGTGGHVGVSSEPGRGSTLRILFPRIAAAPKPPAAETLKASPLVGNETILVAEDQPDLRWMICQYLQTLGYSVLEAKDGGDAIALAEQYAGGIDVLLTDVVMPHVRGPEVVRKLAATRPDMKVIFMSGYTEGEFGEPGRESSGGGAVLLQKPFELDFLAQKIHEVLRARTRR
jgi:CheY-like chemotaxis protein